MLSEVVNTIPWRALEMIQEAVVALRAIGAGFKTKLGGGESIYKEN